MDIRYCKAPKIDKLFIWFRAIKLLKVLLLLLLSSLLSSLLLYGLLSKAHERVGSLSSRAEYLDITVNSLHTETLFLQLMYLLRFTEREWGKEFHLSGLFFRLILCITCHFYSKDFKSLGRHPWRCKERNEHNESVVNSNHLIVTPEREDLQNYPPVNNRAIKCVCSKETKTHGGLKRHHRTCRAITGFNKDLIFFILHFILIYTQYPISITK